MSVRCVLSSVVAAGRAAFTMVSICCIAACAAGAPSASEAGEVHVSLVGKNKVNTFLNRLALADGQIVATRAAVADAEQSVELKEDQGVELYLVEDAPLTTALAGERARIAGVAVVAVPSGKDVHDWLGSTHYYAERIGQREVDSPPAAMKQGAGALSLKRDAIEHGLIDVNVEQAFLEDRLKELSGAVSVTFDGRSTLLRERGSSDGRGAARAWLRHQYEDLGYVVQEHPYGGGGGRGGVNLTADKAGRDPSRVLIISSHYDSVSNAGADDDGAGTVSALAVARALKDANLNIGLRIVAFDEEEVGFVGSRAYVRMLDEADQLRNVVGVLQLEMTGYDSDDNGNYHVIDCHENTSDQLSATVEAAASHGELRLTKVDACTNRSDHSAFWRYGVPAVAVSEDFFGGDGNPCYHESCDRVDLLNWNYMRRLTQAVAVAAADILSR